MAEHRIVLGMYTCNLVSHGKFNVNDLVMTFGALAYNILRWMGLRALSG